MQMLAEGPKDSTFEPHKNKNPLALRSLVLGSMMKTAFGKGWKNDAYKWYNKGWPIESPPLYHWDDYPSWVLS